MSEIKNETLENENWIPGLARFIQQREDVEAIIVDAQKKKIVLVVC